MQTPVLRHAARALTLAILVATACGKDKPASPALFPEPVPTLAPAPAPVHAAIVEPDFALTDANPNSLTSGQTVSPRQ